MYILIKWNDKKYLAKVLQNYKVAVSIGGQDVTLDQCKCCGVWTSEDEELYGDGYCASCCAMCIDCQQYKPREQMAQFAEPGSICKECQSKRYQKLIDDFDDVEAQEGDVKVVFTYIGEGIVGDYGESENDIPHLRFDIFEKSYVRNSDGIEHPDWDWLKVESGSYCTAVPIDTPKEIVEKMAKYILDEVKDNIAANRSIRHTAAALSYIDENMVK